MLVDLDVREARALGGAIVCNNADWDALVSGTAKIKAALGETDALSDYLLNGVRLDDAVDTLTPEQQQQQAYREHRLEEVHPDDAVDTLYPIAFAMPQRRWWQWHVKKGNR